MESIQWNRQSEMRKFKKTMMEKKIPPKLCIMLTNLRGFVNIFGDVIQKGTSYGKEEKKLTLNWNLTTQKNGIHAFLLGPQYNNVMWQLVDSINKKKLQYALQRLLW